jgi:CDP-paratose 2-epimerase
VGSELALGLRRAGHEVTGFDNFIRPGSELNRSVVTEAGVDFFEGDARAENDLAWVRGIDWVIDAAANPSVLAGVDGKTSSRELLEHNLWGTVNLLEVCKREGAGMILLSTSRVYSINALRALPVRERDGAFRLEEGGSFFGPGGVTEKFPTEAPVSLYGASKLASEQLALEYGEAFGFPVWVDRCGVMAGAGQFGKADQGIFSFWIHSWARKAPLKCIGFGGSGYQVRDCLHPRDLLELVLKQMREDSGEGFQISDLRFQKGGDEGFKISDLRFQRVFNVSGGAESAMSLRQLSDWCEEEFGPHEVTADLSPRPYDLPWVVLDASSARERWDWQPRTTTAEICAEIAKHAREHPEWLEITAR